jgi:hypothetical protein
VSILFPACNRPVNVRVLAAERTGTRLTPTICATLHASLLIEQGANPLEVAPRMGHTDASITHNATGNPGVLAVIRGHARTPESRL